MTLDKIEQTLSYLGSLGCSTYRYVNWSPVSLIWFIFQIEFNGRMARRCRWKLHCGFKMHLADWGPLAAIFHKATFKRICYWVWLGPSIHFWWRFGIFRSCWGSFGYDFVQFCEILYYFTMCCTVLQYFEWFCIIPRI